MLSVVLYLLRVGVRAMVCDGAGVCFVCVLLCVSMYMCSCEFVVSVCCCVLVCTCVAVSLLCLCVSVC